MDTRLNNFIKKPKDCDNYNNEIWIQERLSFVKQDQDQDSEAKDLEWLDNAKIRSPSSFIEL